MKITYRKLHELPVETESGVYLGHVSDLIIDNENLQILQLEVQDKKWLTSEKKMLVGVSQVINISDTKIVVQDTLLEVEESITAETQIQTEAATTLNAKMEN